MRGEGLGIVWGTTRVIGLPEDMMNTKQASFDTTDDPCVERVALDWVDMAREGVQLVPIDYREYQPKRLKRGGGRGKDVSERCGLKKGELRRECLCQSCRRSAVARL